MSSEIKVDTISEKTSANGVVIDGVTLKDSKIGGTITIPGSTGTMALTSDISAGGLTYVGGINQTSTAATISVNNVFTSAYDNYLVLYHSLTANGTQCQVNLRLRASGTDVSTGYVGGRFYASLGGTVSSFVTTGTSSFYAMDQTTNGPDRSATVMQIYKPQLAMDTNYSTYGFSPWNDGTKYFQNCYGVLENDNQYDGFTIFADGTPGEEIAAKIAVYGYAKS
jgi:hypothetical protein